MNTVTRITALACAALFTACKEEVPPPLYEAVAVGRRDIVVSAEAAGTVEPILVVDVKSKASGEIVDMAAETGDIVTQGELLVRVDPRDPQNALAQAEADLEVARASLANAEAQKRRSDQMFAAQVLSEQEHELSNLQYANARAQLVRAERAVQNARDQLDDTNVRAPLTGTIIQKSVERGQVIASATREVSGGTVLLRMADLSEVQVRTLVDETDIGKVQPGMRATITVDAYPNRPFEGSVLKIEPQSVVQQNVTMFPVLIRIPNEQGLLRPGMGSEVEVHIGRRQGVLAIPNAALRTNRDVSSAAQVLGLDPADVERTLAAADSVSRANPQLAGAGAPSSTAGNGAGRPEAASQRGTPVASATPAPPAPSAAAPGQSPGGGRGFQLPEGVTREQLMEIRRKREAGEQLTAQESTLSARMQAMRQQSGAPGGAGPTGGPGSAPGGMAAQGSGPAAGPPQASEGGNEEQMRALFNKMRSGQSLTPAEQALVARMRSQMGSGGGTRRRFGAGNNFQFGGTYIVFVLREGQPVPVRVRTGITDMDYSEVVSGLTEQDSVILLPSASLVQSQQEMRERFNRMTGGGGLPGMRQQPAPGTTTPAAPPGGGGPR